MFHVKHDSAGFLNHFRRLPGFIHNLEQIENRA